MSSRGSACQLATVQWVSRRKTNNFSLVPFIIIIITLRCNNCCVPLSENKPRKTVSTVQDNIITTIIIYGKI